MGELKTRETFVAAVRETLALTIERGIELPQPTREPTHAVGGPNGGQRAGVRTRE